MINLHKFHLNFKRQAYTLFKQPLDRIHGKPNSFDIEVRCSVFFKLILVYSDFTTSVRFVSVCTPALANVMAYLMMNCCNCW